MKLVNGNYYMKADRTNNLYYTASLPRRMKENLTRRRSPQLLFLFR